ncbi:MAG: hypothetical protein KKF12_13575 [Proteobacteria bacterium]|nr:hypothetical protein [Pseudomonadota bacterium]MBU4131846.1 hypothetical protein [Pseudomonadota bacterium]
MTYDFCLGCDVLLAPRVYECPVCGFDNSFNQYQDIISDEAFLNDFDGAFTLEDDPVY